MNDDSPDDEVSSRDASLSPLTVSFLRPRENEPRAHHTVPRFYLKQWSHRKTIRWHNKSTHRSTIGSVKRASVEHDFYKAELETGETTYGIERLLSFVEDNAAPAIRRLIDDPHQVNTPSIRQRLIAFAAWQAVRGRSQREWFVQAANESIESGFHEEVASEEFIRQRIQDMGLEATPARVKESWDALEAIRNGTWSPRAAAVNHMLAVALEAMKFFDQAYWHVIRFTAPSLITTDRPVTAVGSVSPRVSEVIFPLAPTLLLVATKEARVRHFTAHDDIAWLANKHLATLAYQWIYGSPTYSRWDELVEFVSGVGAARRLTPLG